MITFTVSLTKQHHIALRKRILTYGLDKGSVTNGKLSLLSIALWHSGVYLNYSNIGLQNQIFAHAAIRRQSTLT